MSGGTKTFAPVVFVVLMPLVRTSALPLIENPPPPKVTECRLLTRLLTVPFCTALPRKSTSSEAAGNALPDQLAAVVHRPSEPSPTQVRVAADAGFCALSKA